MYNILEEDSVLLFTNHTQDFYFQKQKSLGYDDIMIRLPCTYHAICGFLVGMNDTCNYN